MKSLIDNALSPLFARALSDAGHDAVHVRDLGLRHEPDQVAEQDRIIVSADTDFGTILALRDVRHPSVILLRGHESRRPELQAQRLLPNLPDLVADLEEWLPRRHRAHTHPDPSAPDIRIQLEGIIELTTERSLHGPCRSTNRPTSNLHAH